ncbi:amidase family protein [Amycolatopsis sp. FDAARGOS 1241]|uniref:amidase family protein n=1 Tax=Amycolatopsis sp. FDAARGOS 1241 TaxID=2778070 RepID=UPI00194F0538|nr:amidase family protein [Amycolatopsis sp. FDAARGOS 1241]QRP47853.1 hypothetical protein I6J71_08035 [Amycolatopsis sp. FDAARGOS 1241]
MLTAEASAYQSHTLRRTPDLSGDDVRLLTEVGEAILATDYINAQRLRTAVRSRFKQLFERIDFLLTPTVSAPADPRSDPYIRWPDGLVEGASEAYTRFCIPANVTGFPALQLPAGRTESGLPLCVQLLGPPCAENTLLSAGLAIERQSSAERRLPPPPRRPGVVIR